MAVSNVVVPMVRVLAIIHIVVGALLIAFSIIYAIVGYILSFAVPAVFMGVWVSLASLLKFRFRVMKGTRKYIAHLRNRFTHSRLPARSLISKYKSFEFPLLKALGGEEVKMRWMICFRKFFASASCRC